MSRRVLVIVLLVALSTVAAWAAWHRFKERYLIPWLGVQLTRTIEHHTGWRLSYGSITSRLLSEADLYAVRLQPSSGATWVGPHAAQIMMTADHLHMAYTPLDLLQRRIRRMDVEGSSLVLGKTRVAFSVAHTDGVTAVSCPPQRLALEELRRLFEVPERVGLQGTVRVSAEFLAKQFRPELVHIAVQGQDLSVGWGAAFNAKADIDLVLSGPPSAPMLRGRVDVRRGRWIGLGQLPIGTALGGGGRPLYLRIAERYPGPVSLRVRGSNLAVQTDQLRVRAAGNLALEKGADGPAQLVGVIHAVDGSYTVRNLRFRILDGTITFLDEPEPGPRLTAMLETRVKRYRIRAGMSGTVRDSRLRLTSQPELPRQDILALLIFGRPLSRLSQDERERLSQQDMDAQTLDLLFLGRAETFAARWLGLDEINVTVTPEALRERGPSRAGMSPGEAPGPSPFPIESVEVGKYVIPDRLFGSYQLEPGQALGQPSNHTLGAEYELSGTVSVGATVKGGMEEEQPLPVDPQVEPKRRLAAEEAFIRFRWKF